MKTHNNKTFIAWNFFREISLSGLFLTICFAANAQHFETIWSGGAFNPMTITVTAAQINGNNMVAGDEIGIFDGSLCVGAAVLTQEINTANSSTFLYITVSKDDGSTNGYTVGNTINYRLYKADEDKEAENVDHSFPYDPTGVFENFQENETAIVALSGTISQDSPEITGVDDTDVLCNGGQDGTITIAVSGGTSPYEYSIDNGSSWQSSNSFTGLSAGDYYVKAKDNNASIATWASNPIQINQPSEIIINNVSKTDLSASGADDGSITIEATGGTGTLEYSVDNGNSWQNSNSFTNLRQDDYYIKVKDENNCIKEYTNNPVSITVSNNFNIISVDKTDVSICFGNTNGSITITASGGTSPFEYSIDNGGSWQSSSTFTGLAAGEYNIQARDDNDVSATWASNPVEINQPSEIVISVAKQNLSNAGANDGVITVSASGGTGNLEFSIDNGSTWHTSNSFSNLAAGDYNIKVKDVNDCVKVYPYNPVTLSASNNLTIDLVEKTDVTLCYGNSDGSITITSSGGTSPYEYSIDNGNTWYSSNSFSGISGGQYYIKVKDGDNSIVSWASNPININQPPEIFISYVTKQDLSAPGADDGNITIAATGGTGSRKFSIDNGTSWFSSNSFTGLSIGDYYVQIKDANDCIKVYDDNPVTISEPSGVTSPALLFDGTDDYAELNGFSYPDANFTIEAWIKPGLLEETREILFGRNNEGAFQFRIEIDGTLVYGESPPWTFVSSTDTKLKLNEWNHVAVVRSNGMCTIYIDGINSGEGRVDNGFSPSTISIGARAADMDRFFKGLIVEVRIWNLARTQNEIQENMYGFLNGSETGLIGYWHMNEGEGQKAIDHSNNRNDLQLGFRTSPDDYDPAWVSAIWPFESSTLSIYDIQYTSIPGSEGTYPSLMADEEVKTQGIVTAVGYSGKETNFFISSPFGGEWQGIYIYSGDLAPNLGDKVEVSGMIKEYYGLTEFYWPQVVVLSSGNQLPEPCKVRTGDIADPIKAEAFEGCLVSIEDITITKEADNLGQWYVDDGSGECQIDDKIFGWNNIAVGLNFQQIIGILDYDWGEYGLIPRFESDLSLSTGIPDNIVDDMEYLIFPNPTKNSVYIKSPQIADLAVYTTTGKKLLEKKNFFGGVLDVTGFRKGIYYVIFSAKNDFVSKKLIIK